jgi:hypothetical protein
MPNLTTNLRHHPLPSVTECEAATALHIAQARAIASEKILAALNDDQALPAPMLKLCIDALKLSVDRAAAPVPDADPTTFAPELHLALERILRLAGDTFAAATNPAKPVAAGAAS